MAIFSRYAQVVEADGSPMSVRTALALINQALDEFLAEQGGGVRPRHAAGSAGLVRAERLRRRPFGDAETLSKAKNTSVGGMVEAGFLHACAGKVRLLRREEAGRVDAHAATSAALCGRTCAGSSKRWTPGARTPPLAILSQLTGAEAESARDLAYRLYTLCERKGWAQEATAYNGLVVTWPELQRRAHDLAASAPQQDRLL